MPLTLFGKKPSGAAPELDVSRVLRAPSADAIRPGTPTAAKRVKGPAETVEEIDPLESYPEDGSGPAAFFAQKEEDDPWTGNPGTPPRRLPSLILDALKDDAGGVTVPHEGRDRRDDRTAGPERPSFLDNIPSVDSVLDEAGSAGAINAEMDDAEAESDALDAAAPAGREGERPEATEQALTLTMPEDRHDGDDAPVAVTLPEPPTKPSAEEPAAQRVTETAPGEAPTIGGAAVTTAPAKKPDSAAADVSEEPGTAGAAPGSLAADREARSVDSGGAEWPVLPPLRDDEAPSPMQTAPNTIDDELPDGTGAASAIARPEDTGADRDPSHPVPKKDRTTDALSALGAGGDETPAQPGRDDRKAVETATAVDTVDAEDEPRTPPVSFDQEQDQDTLDASEVPDAQDPGEADDPLALAAPDAVGPAADGPAPSFPKELTALAPGETARSRHRAITDSETRKRKSKGQGLAVVSGPPLIEQLTPLLLWTSVALLFASVVWGAVDGGVSLTVLAIGGGGIFVFASLLLVGRMSGAFSPLLLTGTLLRRSANRRIKAERLAGHDVLAALGLAEAMLDADVDARLVTTREGVVVYASDQYVRLAREAGVMGVTGLPPRIDRLFSQAKGDSSKMFRLARAARGGIAADEVITQTMGTLEGEALRRRFEVSVRPMADDMHLAWRLREVPVENVSDTFRTAYENFPRPVMAVEKSGNVAWMNAAAAELLGVRVQRDVALADVVLGEAKDLTAALWEDDPEEVEARVRTRGAAQPHCSMIFTPFTRAGVGEGFVCTEMIAKVEAAPDQAAAGALADLSEAPLGIALIEGDVGTDAKLSSVNKLFTTAFGAETGMRLSEALPGDAVRDLAVALKTRPQGKALTRHVDVTVGGPQDARNFRILARPIKRRRGAYGPRQTVLYALDVSFEKRMEEDYAHDKRLSVIGKIAGSVAHDFNNFLQSMMGATEFLMRRHPAGDPSYPDLVAIRENAQRARNLTQNLLAFSRKQTLRSEVLEVPELLSDFTPFVQRLVTEKVKVIIDHGRAVGAIKADRSQLELAVMNLAVNARDVMDKGGQLTLRSRRVGAEEVDAYGYDRLETVDYVLIEVADTGPGVPEDIAAKIFEPFFTTKAEGKGTGLGLSTVDGIIAQLGGHIFLLNEPGEGATFRIFLPALSEEEVAAARSARKTQRATTEVKETDDLTGKGRILIVEDEDSVRNIVVRALGMCGYEIVQAADGEEALDIIAETDTPFDVVLSDIMMPEMDGPTLVQEAGARLNGARIIFMSGYAETAMRDKLEEIEGARYLQKPFTLKMVASVVKDAMAG